MRPGREGGRDGAGGRFGFTVGVLRGLLSLPFLSFLLFVRCGGVGEPLLTGAGRVGVGLVGRCGGITPAGDARVGTGDCAGDSTSDTFVLRLGGATGRAGGWAGLLPRAAVAAATGVDAGPLT